MSKAPRRLKQRQSNGHSALRRHTLQEMRRDCSMPICHCIDDAASDSSTIFTAPYIDISHKSRGSRPA